MKWGTQMEINKCPRCKKRANLWKGAVAIYSVNCPYCNWVGGVYTNITDAINAWNEQEAEYD